MKIKQIVTIAFYLICVVKSAKAECNPYSLFGENKECEQPEERNDELYVRTKLYRLSNFQFFSVILILIAASCGLRWILWPKEKTALENSAKPSERECDCAPIPSTADINRSEKVTWMPTSTSAEAASENSKTLMLVSPIKRCNTLRLDHGKGDWRDIVELKYGMTAETVDWLTRKVILKDRRPLAARSIFTVGWATVSRNATGELEKQGDSEEEKEGVVGEESVESKQEGGDESEREEGGDGGQEEGGEGGQEEGGESKEEEENKEEGENKSQEGEGEGENIEKEGGGGEEEEGVVESKGERGEENEGEEGGERKIEEVKSTEEIKGERAAGGEENEGEEKKDNESEEGNAKGEGEREGDSEIKVSEIEELSSMMKDVVNGIIEDIIQEVDEAVDGVTAEIPEASADQKEQDDSDGGKSPSEMKKEPKDRMADLLETKLALEQEWESSQNTRSSIWQDRMRKAEDCLRALRAQVQELVEFTKQHANTENWDSMKKKVTRSVENIARYDGALPNRTKDLPPPTKPLMRCDDCPPQVNKAPSPQLRAVRPASPMHQTNLSRSASPPPFPMRQPSPSRPITSPPSTMRQPNLPRPVSPSRATAATQTPLRAQDGNRTSNQWSQAPDRKIPQRTTQPQFGGPTSFSFSLGGPKPKCCLEQRARPAGNLLCPVCRRNHL